MQKPIQSENDKSQAEQDARNALYLEEQRKRKAAGLPPPPSWTGEWPKGV